MAGIGEVRAVVFGLLNRMAEIGLLKHGVVDSFSIGYMIREGGSRMVAVRELTNIEILELSIATIPANPRAQLV
jgi:phage head maturation protease